MLKAYFDDSGTHEGSLVTALGGCVAQIEQWVYFEQEWRGVLEEEHVKIFHMTDLESLRGEYEGWDEERKRRFIGRMLKIISPWAKRQIASLVIAKDYDDVVPPWAKKIPAFGDKYNFCFQMCLGQTMNWVASLDPPMPAGDQIAFMFEQQDRVEGVTSANYTKIKRFRDPDDKMGAFGFGAKSRFLPLQAADFIAYEAYKHLDNLVKSSGRPLRKSLNGLLDLSYGFSAYYFDGAALTALVHHYEETKGRIAQEPWWPWAGPGFRSYRSE